MKAPYFELQADEETKTAAGFVLADTRPVKFKRRRALNCLSTLFTVGDEHTRRCFDEGKDTYKGAYNRRAYAKNVAIYFVLFPALFLIFTVIFAAIIFLGTLQTAMAEIPALLVLFLIFWVVSGGSAVVLAAWRIYKGKYLKSAFYHLDVVYVVHAKSGAPCIICAEQNRVRVLYGEKLTVILKNGEQTETNPKKVYLAYLDMFPQSALDMGAFVKDRKKYFLAGDTGYR
ncbi:MAG: hypothetical protein K2N30_02230, partial [Clostridia bacterium]|nr:hypothetical protein [Clostridia bacterium]